MTETRTHLAEANDAYQAALASLARIHEKQREIADGEPVDWTAYNASLAAAGSAQATAQEALSVYQAAILDTPEVRTLVAHLKTDTAAMSARAAALTKAAYTLRALAGAADIVTSVLGAIARFA